MARRATARRKEPAQETVLDTAARAMRCKDYPLLAAAARAVGQLCAARAQSYLLDALLLIAAQLGKRPEFAGPAVEADMVALAQTLPGSPRERQALELLCKHVAKLADPDPLVSPALLTMAQTAMRYAALQSGVSALTMELKRAAAVYVERDPEPQETQMDPGALPSRAAAQSFTRKCRLH
jgi:hypothetical protein